MKKRIRIPKLKFKISFYKTGEISWKELIDKNGREWGEYIDYWQNGNIKHIGFNKCGEQIGLWKYYNEDGSFDENFYSSMIEPGKEISENEHKKELAMLRLGLIECPEFDILIKDYE